jgi:hypothetical protein
VEAERHAARIGTGRPSGLIAAVVGQDKDVEGPGRDWKSGPVTLQGQCRQTITYTLVFVTCRDGHDGRS